MPSTPTATTCLRQLEDSFTGYPTLIYDGPFSDHLLEKTPQMTRDKPAITPEQAKAIASRVTDRPLPQLRREDSVLPCYVLHDGKNNSVAITRQGGFLCYLVTAKPEALTAPPFLPAGGGQSPAVFAGAGLLLDEGHLL